MTAVVLDATGETAGRSGVVDVYVDLPKLAPLGEGRWPRVYVLDAEGKIVWFDIEYSVSTRRELRAAVESLLADDGQGQ